MEPEQRDDLVNLAQLYKAVARGLNEKHIRRIIDRQRDLNLVIPDSSIFKSQTPALVGSTLLHVAWAEGESESFDLLLDKGADYTIKNAAGSTALHEVLEEIFKGRGYRVTNCYVDSVLRAHVRDGNFANPRDKHGISHFHAACAANNERAVELFLQNGVSADHAVSADSPVFPGYTPLHVVARCGSAEAAEMLLRHGASLEVKDAAGATPLHVLVQKQLMLLDKRNSGNEDDDEDFQKKVERNEKMMRLFLGLDETDGTVAVDDLGLSTLHVACTMLDTTLAERLLKNTSDVDHSVKTDSALWPGYTALHFAALSNIDTVKLLLNKGANMEAKNTEGSSPFDMCLERYGLNDICYIISCHPIWRDIQFLNSDVRLVDFINALYNTSKLINMARNFFVTTQSSLPLDSPLWPGSTPLHLAVTFFERKKARFHTKEPVDEEDDYEDEEDLALKVVKLFFDTKYFEPVANVLARDAYGRTPIHLAYKKQKRCILDFLFEHNDKTENPIDIDDVSMLHIACLMEKQQLIEELLFIGEDANMPIICDLQCYRSRSDVISARSTPLHIAMLTENRNGMQKLLTAGADPFAKDANKITPIHQVLTSGRKSQSQIFVSSTDLLNVAVPGGVTYLHIACIAGDREAVKKLIELGADVNATIGFERPIEEHLLKLDELLTPYLGSTPLHLALKCDSLSAVEVLISRGADLFASNSDESIPIVKILRKKCTKYANVLLLNLQYNDTMQANLKNKTGLTLLHIACNALDIKLVTHLLDSGAEVNAQAHSDSPVWPGCTPLHVLLLNLKDRLETHGSSRNRYVDDFYVILKLLMSHGADVTLMNADKETATDISSNLYRSYIRAKTWLCTMLPSNISDYYDLNFVDKRGISLFQDACYQCDINVVQEFLKRGVNVNQRVDVLSGDFAGYTPLHFAAKQRWPSLVGSPRHIMTLELLLDHGADVHARDADDNTPLHIVVQEHSSRQELIEKLLKSGADLNAVNMFGRTPFEVLLKSSDVSSAEVAVFLQNGARVNSYNSVTGAGYVPLIFEAYDIEFDEVVTAMIDNTPDLTAADDEGRTIIHNLVSCMNRIDDPPGGLSALCTRFIERGCDIDQQDKSGKTPLHTAVQWDNENAVLHLLTMNANAAIVDNAGKTALDYASEKCDCEEPCEDSDHIRYLFAIQAFKFELTGFQELAAYKDLKKTNVERELSQIIRRLMKKAKKTHVIPDELTLYDFASETGAVSSYLHMPILKRRLVDEYFKSMNKAHFGRVSAWLKNHHAKAVARAALIEPAKQALNGLIGFSLPHLCSDGVFRFLSNVELRNLIAASVEDSGEKSREM